MKRWMFGMAGALAIAACGDGGGTTNDDAGDGSADAGDTGGSDGASDGDTDDGGDDTASDGDTANDSGDGDSGDSDTGDTGDTADDGDTGDTASDGDTESDGGDGDVVAAVPGVRCALSERVAQIDLEAIGNGTFYLNGWITDRPDPWFGEPEWVEGACSFHRFDPTAACEPCAPGALCSVDGTCVPAPKAVPGAVVTLAASGATQDFSAADESGYLYGPVTLAGDRFSLALTIGDVRVTVAEMTVPGALADLTGNLEGDYDAPTRLSLSWSTTGLTDSTAFTRIPINHHAAGPTFAECALPASTGALEVGEAMLAPLAVITGLEFQGLDHVRFAAAETPAGCVEIRYLQRNYVGLF